MRIPAFAFACFAGMVAIAGCAGESDPPADPELAAGARAEGAPAALLSRVWTSAEPDAPRGAMLVFLADGTLVQDSCWETYRLSSWRAEPDGTLRWSEDGAEIRASIGALSAAELVLRLQLAGGIEEQRYTATRVPYVCPDLPR